jgi:hypothetical protein
VAILSTLVIEDLGPSGERVELRGAGLPLKGASWKGTQNVKTTWYPGNSIEATQQVLGPQEEPSEWEGEWNRTRLAKTPCVISTPEGDQKVVSPFDLWDALDEFRIKGTKLRVQWIVQDENGSTRATRSREGRLTSLEGLADTAYDVRWKARFDWSGRGGAQQKAVSTREGDLASATRGLASSANEIAGVAARSAAQLERSAAAQAAADNTAPPIATSTFLTLGSLETIALGPAAIVDTMIDQTTRIANDVGRIIGVAQKAATIPSQIASAGKTLAASMRLAVNQGKDQIDRTPVETMTHIQDVVAIGRSMRYFGRVHDAANQLGTDASKMEDRLIASGPRALVPRKTVEVHVCKDGDTMASVSQKHYGTPDRAVDIARANHLPWHQRTLTPGRTLVIPILDPQRTA